MNREKVIATLREHEPELKAAGVVRLSLFGSTVRGDRSPDSDIDLLAAFDETRRISLPDVVGIELRLSELLGQTVELGGGRNPQTARAEKRRGRGYACLLASSDPLQRFQDILENIGRIEDLFRQTRCSSSARLRRN